MHLVGFIIRIYHEARSSECQVSAYFCVILHVTQEMKLQQPTNNYVIHTRPFDVLRDDDTIRFGTCSSFKVLM